METVTFPRRDVQELLATMVCMKINAGGLRPHPLADKFGVRAFPTLVLLDPTGEVLSSVRGAPQPEDFTSFFAIEDYNAVVKAYNRKDGKAAAPHAFRVRQWYEATPLAAELDKFQASLAKLDGFREAYEEAKASYAARLEKLRAELRAEEERRAELERLKEERRERAKELKTEADELYRKYLRTKAYKIYRQIIKECPDTPEAAEARALLVKNKQKLE